MNFEDYPVKLKLRIDWSELDYFGHVNNVSFYKYIQAARVNVWDRVGMRQYHLDHNVGPMLAECVCRFKRPLFFPGEVTIHSQIAFMKNTSFGFEHILTNERGETAAEANDVMVMYDFNADRKMSIPSEFRDLFNAL